MSRKSRFLGLFLFLFFPFLFLPKKILATNLLKNPGFEDGIFPWTKYGGEFDVTSNPVHSGESAGVLASDTNSTKWIYQTVPIVGGKVYRYSGFSVKNDPNISWVLLRIAWYNSPDGSGSELSHDDSVDLLNDDNPEYRFLTTDAVVAPDNANSARAKVVIAFNSTNQVQAYFDDLSFEEVMPPSPTPTLTPTPTQISSSPTPVPASYSNIYISEFMPYPESGNEWVELYNDNDFEVNLWGWYIDDLADGGSPPKSISGTIAPRSYKQFFISDFYFNNDGDEVRLLDGSKSEEDSTSFEKSIKGKSWSKDKNGNWCQAEPTPNSPNSDCLFPTSPPTPPPTPTPTPTSIPIKTPTPSKTPTPTSSLIPTEEDKLNLLGETSGNSSVLGAQVSPIKIPENKNKLKITAGIFIFSGLVLLGISGFFFLKEKLLQLNKPDERI